VEGFKFQPHITLLKFKQGKGSFKQIKQVKAALKAAIPQLHAEFSSLSLGEQIFESVDLLSMQEKDNEGYYKCCGRLYFKHFTSTNNNNNNNNNNNSQQQTNNVESSSNSNKMISRFNIPVL